MSLAQRKPMTVAEFLDWAERQDRKWEFDGVGPVPWGGQAQAMGGGTNAHLTIGRNVVGELFVRLRGRPCQPYGSDAGVETGVGTLRYPDAVVSCVPQDRRGRAVREPVVVFEVLSPSSARTDRSTKLAEYGATPSVRRYVLLEQDEVMATVFARDEAGEWVGRVLRPGATLALPECGVAVPLDALYEGLNFSDDPEADAAAG